MRVIVSPLTYRSSVRLRQTEGSLALEMFILDRQCLFHNFLKNKTKKFETLSSATQIAF